MKYLLAALSGMALTLCVFIGGAAFAIRYLAAEPVPVQRTTGASAPLMPTDVVRVDSQIAAEPLRHDEAGEPALDIDSIEPRVEIEPMPAIDDFTTASITEPETPAPATVRDPAPSLSDQHVRWCRDRYRSYRAENNNYTPYSGGSRECVSPFSDDNIVTNHASVPEEDIIYLHDSAGRASSDDIIYLDASARGSNEGRGDASSAYLSPEHIESCFSRYRSYRPKDNTYQPYGGGPRRQCK